MFFLHILHCVFFFCLTFLRYAFSNVSSNGQPEQKHSHIGCICTTFLRCAFSNVSSNGLHEQKRSYIGCICLTFLRCAFSNVSSNCLPEQKKSHIFIWVTFLRCAFSNVFSNCLHRRMHSRIDYIYLTCWHFLSFLSGHFHLLNPNHIVWDPVPLSHFSQMVAWNWVKYKINFWSIIKN